MFNNVYNNKRVLLTGHNGFKGSWLALWLKKLGAEVTGFSLPPFHQPNHFNLLKLDIEFQKGDIRNLDKLVTLFRQVAPEIVFHLAAQPLVRFSYKNPVETFTTNVLGTVNVFEACRKTRSVRAIVNITSDKCYDNRESVRGYRESDPMGGKDPYSCSKGCAELITTSYRDSFFSDERNSILVASARSGNVFGGGDWSEDRLVPDIMKAAMNGESAIVRNPKSIRPWQHVLEPLSGYLLLGQLLIEGKSEFACAWNFGPKYEDHIKVADLAEGLKQHWNRINYKVQSKRGQFFENQVLKLDCSMAKKKLMWHPVWNIDKAIEMTATWYRNYYENQSILTENQLDDYLYTALNKRLAWSI